MSCIRLVRLKPVLASEGVVYTDKRTPVNGKAGVPAREECGKIQTVISVTDVPFERNRILEAAILWKPGEASGRHGRRKRTLPRHVRDFRRYAI